MKILSVLRHPKQDEISSSDDFFTPLSTKGIEDAKIISTKLLEKNIIPDLIVSSPSLRTETTSMILAQQLDIKKNILYNEVLYQGYLDELIEELTFTFHTIDSLLIVGHNPLLENLINAFVPFKQSLEMGMLIQIQFDTNSWVDIGSHNANILEIIKP